jgi:hypothetical protein
MRTPSATASELECHVDADTPLDALIPSGAQPGAALLPGHGPAGSLAPGVSPAPIRTPSPKVSPGAGPFIFIAPQMRDPYRMLRSITQSTAQAQALSERLEGQVHGWDWLNLQLPADEATACRPAYAAWRQACGSSFLALVVVCLQRAAARPLTPAQRNSCLQGLKMLRPPETRRLAEHMLAHPEFAQTLCAALAVQERLELYQRGDSYSTFNEFTQSFVGAADCLPDSHLAQAAIDQVSNQAAPNLVLGDAAPQVHGRTLQFPQAAGPSMAIKLQKQTDDALRREDIMDQCFAAWKNLFGLQSELPRSYGLLRFAPSAASLAAVTDQAQLDGEKTFAVALQPDGFVDALLYEAPAAYHVHLHEVSTLEELKTAAQRCMHDAGVLAGRLGLLNQAPADMFHNKEKLRHYHWNVDPLRRAVGNRVGAGRLDQWENAIRTINEGPSGLRDYKHYRPLHLCTDAYRRRGMRRGDAKSFRLGMTSLSGDVLLAHSLSVAKWFKDQGKLCDHTTVAAVLADNYATFFAAYTGRPLPVCTAFLQSIIDWPMLAAQLDHFMGSAYVADVQAQRLPKELFAPGCETVCCPPQEGWDAVQGWLLDGKNRDLGPKNGPLPLVELVRALYLTTSFALLLRRSPSPTSSPAEARSDLPSAPSAG